MLTTNSYCSATNIIYKDGLVNKYDNKGNEIMYIQMEVGSEMYPIENVGKI